MPLRTVTLENGCECTRNIINTHPDGKEFLPEDLFVDREMPLGKEIYNALERLINSADE